MKIRYHNVCIEPGCDQRGLGLGWCPRHYSMHRQRAYRRGDWTSDLVDARPAQRHLQRLIAQGYPRYRLARMADLTYSTLCKVAAGERKQIETRTAQRILRIDPTKASAPGLCRMPAVGARRRIESLYAFGYTMNSLSQMSGVCKASISKIVRGDQDWISLENDRRIREVYRKLEMTPGTDNRARIDGARRGYVVPMLWDEEAIDDPKAKPSKYALERAA